MNIGICRVSSVGQKDNTSLDNQERMIKDYCKTYSIKIDKLIHEIYTGTTSDREGLNKVKDLVQKGIVESIIVMKLDRLMRSFSEGVIFIKFLMDNNVKIISVQEKLDTSSISGRFLMNILLSMSEMERDTIISRMDMGKQKNFNDHKRVSGRISFGYKKVDNDLSLDHNNSKIVQYIFKRYLDLRRKGLTKTKSMRKLRGSLNKLGYTYNGSDFTSPTIKYILNNGFYCGILTEGNRVGVHTYDRIISKRLFNRVNEVMK